MGDVSQRKYDRTACSFHEVPLRAAYQTIACSENAAHVNSHVAGKPSEPGAVGGARFPGERGRADERGAAVQWQNLPKMG